VKTKNSLISTEVTFKQTIKVKLLIFDYYKELYKSVELYDENKLRIQKFLISAAKDGGIFPYKIKPQARTNSRGNDIGKAKKIKYESMKKDA
jgi:hypothetical protein